MPSQSSLGPYHVEAFNTAKESENKIHDDAVARRFGFKGGLVPGVEVYAYMTHLPVARWGRPWLEHGAAECRLLKPVYDGDTAIVTATETPDGLDLRVDSHGEICATGRATLPRATSLVPAVFAAARANLKNPPKIYTEIAIEQIPGIVGFFQTDVPAAFVDAKDAAAKEAFAKSNAAVIAALQSYGEWLKSDLLPRSHGDFRIGADTFSKKLHYDEMVDIPLDRLLEIDRANMKTNQDEFKRIAHEVDPTKTTAQVLAELEADHPKPDQLLQAFRDTFDGLIAFINQKHIITVPSDVRPIVEETPPFERAITTASMDTPGPYEKVAKEAFFNVTLPGPHDTPEEIEGRMQDFNVGTIISTAVHETYPGHYIQFLWVPQAPTKIRKLLGAATDVEGWAHYCEQMMLDEGYGQPGTGAKDERESKLIRLGQLQDALLRNARFVVGIEMHRGNLTFDQAVDFFEKEGYQTHQIGTIETKRGTSNPTYLYYTLGKLEILKLRADVQEKQGAAFTLQKFHDDFMRQGFPPIKIVRKAMLGDDSPPL